MAASGDGSYEVEGARGGLRPAVDIHGLIKKKKKKKKKFPIHLTVGQTDRHFFNFRPIGHHKL